MSKHYTAATLKCTALHSNNQAYSPSNTVPFFQLSYSFNSGCGWWMVSTNNYVV